MNLIDAFLWFTTISYYTFALVPEPTTKTFQKNTERLFMVIMGIFLTISSILNIPALWLSGGFMWSTAACLSYLGYIEWNIQWKKETSDTAQTAMWLWDTTIALCCLIKF